MVGGMAIEHLQHEHEEEGEPGEALLYLSIPGFVVFALLGLIKLRLGYKTRPAISPPHLPPYLPTSPHISLHLPTSPYISQARSFDFFAANTGCIEIVRSDRTLDEVLFPGLGVGVG